jgi:hypothetical protein
VDPPPQLRLFLDATETFQQPGNDQAPTYLPGTVHNASSNQPTHESVPPQPEGTPLTTVRLIAAWA